MDKTDVELQKQLEEEFLAALEDYSPTVRQCVKLHLTVRYQKKLQTII